MNGSNLPSSEKTPRWETITLVLSFGLVWVYFLAFQGARRENQALHFGWTIALLAVVALLLWIFVRRIKRILAALQEQKKQR